MHFLKSFLRGLASLGFKFGLVSLALVSAIIMVFGTSTALKRALSGSKIYDNLIDNAITTAKKEQASQTTDFNLSLDEPPIKQAANTAFSPGIIQSSTEQIIDGIYGWLRGKTAKPEFRIDLSVPKQQFATAAADNAAARARQLPACSLQQARELTASGNIDPFTVPCLPPGLSISQARDKVISDLANNQDFLKDPVITSDSLPKDSQGKTAVDNLSQAPKIFHWMMLAPWIIGGLTLFSGALLIFLYDQKRRGLRAIGVILLGSGVFLLIGTWLFSYLLSQANKPGGRLGKLANNGLQNNFIAVLRSLNSAVSHKLLVFGAVYAGLGAITLLVLHFTRPKADPPQPAAGTDNPAAETANASEEKAAGSTDKTL